MKKTIMLIFLGFFTTISIFAKSTGQLSGRVSDEHNNPISGVTIIVENTSYNAQSNEKGYYLIKNMDVGKYNIIASLIGYTTHKTKNVRLKIDETTVINFTLKQDTLKIEGIIITEPKFKLVDKLNTASGAVFTEQSIENLDVKDVQDLIALQAGGYVNNGELHIRGGRVNEVKYIVDGISISDPIDNTSALSIDVNTIKEMKVMTGGFPAEYGNAQSGIVNIVTKNGADKYSGKIEFQSDHILKRENKNNDVVKFMLSGPVIPALKNKLRFFINTTVDNYDGAFKDYYGDNPYDYFDLNAIPWEEYDYYNPYKDRKKILGITVSERNYNKYNGAFKLQYKINPKEKIELASYENYTLNHPYNHFWKFALDHYKEEKITQKQYIGSYTNTINSNLHLEIKAGYYSKIYKEHPLGVKKESLFIKDPDSFDPESTSNDMGNTTGIIYGGNYGYINDYHNVWYVKNFNLENWFKSPGSYYPNFIVNKNDIFTFKVDVDYQYNSINSFRTGIEFIKHNIKRDKTTNIWVLDEFRYREYLYTMATPIDTTFDNYGALVYLYNLDDLYNATLYASGETYGVRAYPMQLSYYLQDEMKWEGLVVNAGLRVDSWYLGKSYSLLNDQNEFEEIVFDKDKRFHIMLSPRLGVSHAVSEMSVVHFAFNYQNQLPEMKTVYPDATPLDVVTGNDDPTGVVLGNPEIEPQITITGEVGLQHQFSEKYFSDISLYYKKNYNYLSIARIINASKGTNDCYQYQSDNYGSVRGMDITLQRLFSSFFNVSFAYSLAWAQGTNSSSLDYQSEAQHSLREFPLDWDSRHNFGINLNFDVARDEDLYLPFTSIRIPINDFSINTTYNYATGTPYTDNAENVNTARKPHTEVMNMKITKNFHFFGNKNFKIYVKINNLTNYKNMNFGYVSTGSPYYDDTHFDDPDEQYLHDMSTNDPTHVGYGREIFIGTALSW